MFKYANLSEHQKKLRRKASNAWAKRNRQKTSFLLRNWTKKRMEWFYSIKRKNICIICGENDFRCLDYHHKDPSKKIDNIQSMVTHKSVKEILNEIEKCEVICTNCHRKIHFPKHYSTPTK